MTQTPNRVRQRVLLIALTACLAFGGGSAAAQSVAPISLSPTPAASPAGDPSLDEQLAEAQAKLRAMTAERDGLQSLLQALDDVYDPMEADRQLLLELRKPLPELRPDAEAYLARIQRLAAIADPARLGQPASRVLETAPVYLDWRDQTFGSQSEADAAFLSSGASGFSTNFSELKDAILLAVANRLDALLTLRDRIR